MHKILVVTHSAEDAGILKTVLSGARDGPFAVESMTQLVDALERLRTGGIGAILVDLSLPDSEGIATFDQLFAAAPHIPILILSAVEEEPLAVEAVQRGAQGYLSKGYFKSSLVPQALSSVIQRKAVEEALFKEKTRAEIALNSIGDAVICTDTSQVVDYLNAAAEKLTGWSRDDARGRPLTDVFKIVNGTTARSVQNPVEVVLEQDRPMDLPPNTILVRRDGSEVAIEDTASPIHDWDGQLTGAVIVFHDVSKVVELTRKMAYLAQHDTLTDLPNRALLTDRIEHAIAVSRRNHTRLAVLFVDLDDFKQINDSRGHAVGDKLLQFVSKRLSASVRNSDTVGRLGGDEFVILLAEGAENRNFAVTAGKVIAELALPYAVEDQELHVTASIGISIYPDDGKEVDTLIEAADAAMYNAKKLGRNNYQFVQAAEQ
jgi:diguanylate cyclase (GGDEF)-like protein/PAS domain S-box-containing protein